MKRVPVFKLNIEQCVSTQKPAKALCRKCIHQVICKLNVVQPFSFFFVLYAILCLGFMFQKKKCMMTVIGQLQLFMLHTAKRGLLKSKGYCLWGCQNFIIHQFSYAFFSPSSKGKGMLLQKYSCFSFPKVFSNQLQPHTVQS